PSRRTGTSRGLSGGRRPASVRRGLPLRSGPRSPFLRDGEDARRIRSDPAILRIGSAGSRTLFRILSEAHSARGRGPGGFFAIANGPPDLERVRRTCGTSGRRRKSFSLLITFEGRNSGRSCTEGTGSSNGLDGYTALITAGGIGTRLLPFSKEIPKEMLPIIAHDRDDSLELKPLVQAIFEQLFSAGIRNFYIVVGRGKRAIEDHFSPDPRFLEFLEKKSKLPRGMSDFYEKVKSSKLVFLNQPEPLGFGDAVLLGQSLIDGPFIVQAADTIILSDRDEHIERLTGLHQKYGASATVLLRDVPDPRNYGVVEGDYLEPGVLGITSAVEKPETPRSNHAIMPVYVFSDEIFEALASTGPGTGGEIQLTDAIQRLADAGKKVIGVLLQGDELM